jgi:exonuclease SbcC
MRIHLENFLCYTNRTFELGSDGLTLISGPSGTGKTSILRGIFFALFGEGTKLQAYGKTSCKVELDFDDIKIVRTKRPNRLVVNEIYEDLVGQEIINKYFGDNFKTSSYIQQNNLTSFILKSPRDKLEMLETFISKDVCIGAMKKRLHIEMARRRDDLTSSNSNLNMINKIIEETDEPEVVKFPIRCKKESRSRVINNTRIRQKNCGVRITKAENKKQRVYEELVATKVLNAELKGLTSHLSSLNEQSILLSNKLNELGYTDDSNLKKYTTLLKAVTARQELYDFKIRYEERQHELENMERREKEAKEEELIALNKDLYALYSKEDLNNIITDTIASIEDFTKVKQLIKNLSKIDYDSQNLEEIRKEQDLLQQSLEKAQETHRKLELAKDSYTCPSCSKVLQLCDGQLTLCPETGITYGNPQELENATKDVKNLKYKLKKVKENILNQEHSYKLFEEYTHQKQELLGKYEDYNSVDEYLKTLQEDLEYLQEYKATQKALTKKIAKLQSQEDMSETYYISKKRVTEMGNRLRKMEEESKLGEELEIQDREKLSILIDKEKELLRVYKSITEKQTDIQKQQEICKSGIDSAREKHKIKFKKVRTCELMEKWYKKYSCEVVDLYKERDRYSHTLEGIELWQRYEEKRKSYESLRQRVVELKKEENEAREKYGAVMTLKEKMLKAESLAMLHILEIINTHARTFLDIFFPDNPISVQLKPFKTTKKSIKSSINVEIEYKGMECDLLMLSGGELSRVVLAYTLALAEIFNSPLLLLDECTASLDQDMTGIVFEGIRENFNGKLTLIIAHQVISGTFDNIVTL